MLSTPISSLPPKRCVLHLHHSPLHPALSSPRKPPPRISVMYGWRVRRTVCTRWVTKCRFFFQFYRHLLWNRDFCVARGCEYPPQPVRFGNVRLQGAHGLNWTQSDRTIDTFWARGTPKPQSRARRKRRKPKNKRKRGKTFNHKNKIKRKHSPKFTSGVEMTEREIIKQ